MLEYKLKVNENAYDVVIEDIDGDGNATVIVNGKEQRVLVQPSEVQDTPSQTRVTAVTPDPSTVRQSPSGAGVEVCSPLPGIIIRLNVNVGDNVKAGQTIATLEAMKMENSIEAEKAGVVKALYVQQGDSVLQGAKIALID